MALARVKTWISGEVLTASDLNAEFNNILSNARSLISPLTASLDMDGFEFILDGDADTSIDAATDDRIDFKLGGVDLFILDGTAASLVNGITFTGAATGSGATISSTGSDTNVPITLRGKGTGAVLLGQATSTDVRLVADQPIADSSGNEFIKFTKTGTAVNEITVVNSATGNAVQIQATGGDTDISLNLVPKGTGVLQSGGTAVAVAGKQSIWIPAIAMISRTTSGAAPGSTEMATNDIMVRTLDFDAATDEFAQFSIAMPKSWNESTVTAKFYWSHAATITNFAVIWGLQALAVSNDDALDTAVGTAQTTTDTGGTTDDLYISDETSAVTIAGTPAEGDLVVFQVYRDANAGGDTLAVDARLHGVMVFITTNAPNDA